jgi:hypothetical protein
MRLSLTDHVEFWDLGHELFRTTPKTFPVPFIAGDVFDPANLEPVAPFNDAPKTSVPALNTLTSLNSLRGHVSVIHASSFFHLFDEDKQLQLARELACLLSPEPGSVIFGSHGGLSVKGYFRAGLRFTHSPETWEELWDGQVFNKGKVKVEASLHKDDLVDPSMPDHGSIRFVMTWSVTRM